MENQIVTPQAGYSPTPPGGPNNQPPIMEQGILPGIGDLFRQSWELTKKRILVMFLTYLLPFLAILAAVIITVVLYFVISLANSTAAVIFAVVAGICIFVAYIYAMLMSTAGQWTALRDEGENTGAVENLKRARPLVWSLLLVSLILQLVIVGGFVLLIIPGIMLLVWYGFAPVVFVVEGKKGRSALAQSKAYVKGRGWKVFGRYVLLYVVYLVPYFILNILQSSQKGILATVILTLLLLALQFIFTFYAMAFQFALYKHLKASAASTNHEQYMGGVTGWTIWGAVGGVMVIIGLLASVALLALNSARAKSRDAGRLADAREILTAAEKYYNENGFYPPDLQTLVPIYLKNIPAAPMPADGNCGNYNDYSYQTLYGGQDFQLSFCLGMAAGGYSAGPHKITPEGVK